MSADVPGGPVDDPPYDVSACYYDLLANRRGASALPSVPFFTGLACAGMDVLDIGAGTGRVALAVAPLVSTVYCLEPSPAMRVALLTKLSAHAELQERVTVLGMSAPQFTLQRRFHYAYLAGVMQFISSEQRPALFRALADHLYRDATLAMDMVDGTGDLDWAEVLVGECAVGDSRWSVHCSGERIGPMRTRMRMTYRTYLRGELVAEEREVRERQFHRPDEIRVELEAAGFRITGGSVAGQAQDDGGAIVASRR